MITLLIVLALFGLMTSTVAWEKGFWTTIILFAGLACIHFFVAPIAVMFYHWVVANALLTGAIAVGYVVVGVLWSFFRWKLYLSRNIKHDSKLDSIMEGNKSKFAMWIAYWPMDGVWYILGDLLRNFFTNIAEFFSGVYTKMTEGAIAKAKAKYEAKQSVK